MTAESTSGRFVLGLKIEGFGDATASTATDKRYRICTGRSFLDSPGTSDPDELYKDGLMYWPSEVGTSIDFISGTATIPGHTFAVQMTDLFRSALFRYRHLSIAKHITAGGIDATATAITLDKSGIADDTVLYLRREAMRVVSSVGVTYQVERGVLGTIAVPHGVQPRDNVQVYSTIRVLEARRVDLVRVDMSASAFPYVETTLWSGFIRRVYASSPEEMTIDADSVLGLLSMSKLMRNQWKGRVEYWDFGEGDQLGTGFSMKPKTGEAPRRNHILDAIYTGPESPVLIEVDGEGAAVCSGGGRQSSGPYWVDDVFGQDTTQAVRFGYSSELTRSSDISPGTACWEILSSSTQQPAGNGLDPDDVHNLPLASNPAVLLLQILLSMPSEIMNNSAQPVITPQVNHPTYDTGIGNIGAKIDSSWVDVESIEQWGSRFFGGVHKFSPDLGLNCFHLGVGGDTESALSACSRILSPYGCILTVGSSGKLKVVSLADAVSIGNTNTITQEDILHPPSPSQDRMLEGTLETIQATYNLWPEFSGWEIEFRDMYNLDQLPDGWGDAPDFQVANSSEAVVRQMLERLIHRFHVPIPVITIETLRTVNYYPGDVVSLTHEHLFNSAGTKGLENAACLVISRTETLADDGHRIRYELMYTGAIYNRVGYIAPSAKVTGYSVNPITGVTTVTVLVNEFTNPADGIGPFRRDCPDDTDSTKPFQAGDVIQLVDQYGTVRDAAETISSVSQDTIFLANPFSVTPTTTAGQEDIIRVASYDSAVATQKSRWVFVADADNTLGAASDDAFEYTLGEGS